MWLAGNEAQKLLKMSNFISSDQVCLFFLCLGLARMRVGTEEGVRFKKRGVRRGVRGGRNRWAVMPGLLAVKSLKKEKRREKKVPLIWIFDTRLLLLGCC